MIKEQWKAEKTDSEMQHPLEGLRIAWHPGLNLMQRLDAYRIAKTANSLFTHLNNVVEDELIFSEEGDVIGRRPTGDIEEEGYRGAKLIILDTLRALNTGKEDKSDDMEPIVQNLKLIRHLTGATILLIHHTGAGDERTRGSTAVEDGADFTMFVKGRKGKAKVEIRKARAVQPLDFKFEITSQERPELGLTKQVVFRGELEEQDSDDEAPNQLAEYLKKQGEVSREQLLEWAALNGMSRATLDRGGYRVTYIGPGLGAFGFDSKLRAEVSKLQGKPTTTGTEPEPDAATTAEAKPRDKSRYRLWVCPKCKQKVRAATDDLRIMCVRCRRAFVRPD